MDRLVPVYTARDPATAEILKNALEGEGIRCEIEGANQAALAGVLMIRLFVRSEDAARATEFLRSHEHYHAEDEQLSSEDEVS